MASVTEIKKFIDAYHADNQRKFVISYRDDSYKVDLMWKLSDKDLFLSQIRFGNIEEMIIMLDMDVEHYEAIDEYIRKGEKLNIEKLVSRESGLIVDQFTFGDNEFRFFASSTLDELNDTIITAHTCPLSQNLPSQFVTIEGNKMRVVCDDDNKCELQYRSKYDNLIGYMPKASTDEVLEYLMQVNWYGVITPDDVPQAKEHLQRGECMVVTTRNGKHNLQYDYEYELINEH